MDLELNFVGWLHCEISDFHFKFSSMITPKKTVSQLAGQFSGHVLKVEYSDLYAFGMV